MKEKTEELETKKKERLARGDKGNYEFEDFLFTYDRPIDDEFKAIKNDNDAKKEATRNQARANLDMKAIEDNEKLHKILYAIRTSLVDTPEQVYVEYLNTKSNNIAILWCFEWLRKATAHYSTPGCGRRSLKTYIQ